MTGRPMVDRVGFPTSSHPDSMTAELPDRDETWLAALAAGLWPADEYASIVRQYQRLYGGAS